MNIFYKCNVWKSKCLINKSFEVADLVPCGLGLNYFWLAFSILGIIAWISFCIYLLITTYQLLCICWIKIKIDRLVLQEVNESYWRQVVRSVLAIHSELYCQVSIVLWKCEIRILFYLFLLITFLIMLLQRCYSFYRIKLTTGIMLLSTCNLEITYDK